MKIAISGFNNDERFIRKLRENNFEVSETINNEVNFLLTNKDIDDIRITSSKIKHTIANNLPIVCYTNIEELKKINLEELRNNHYRK